MAVSPNVQSAAVLSTTFYSLWFLTAGFVMPRPHIPGWMIWLYWINPVSYTIYGLVGTQLGGISSCLPAAVILPASPAETGLRAFDASQRIAIPTLSLDDMPLSGISCTKIYACRSLTCIECVAFWPVVCVMQTCVMRL